MVAWASDDAGSDNDGSTKTTMNWYRQRAVDHSSAPLSTSSLQRSMLLDDHLMHNGHEVLCIHKEEVRQLCTCGGMVGVVAMHSSLRLWHYVRRVVAASNIAMVQTKPPHIPLPWMDNVRRPGGSTRPFPRLVVGDPKSWSGPKMLTIAVL